MKLNTAQKIAAAALATTTLGLSAWGGVAFYEDWNDPVNVADRARARSQAERARLLAERDARLAANEAEYAARDQEIEDRRGAWRDGKPQPAQPAGWDDGETFDYCYAQAPNRLGRVKWGFLGTPDYSIWPTLKTVILKGEYQTTYGGWRPFAIECKETASGPQVVEVNRL